MALRLVLLSVLVAQALSVAILPTKPQFYASYTGHASGINALVTSADKKVVYSASSDRSIHAINIRTQANIFKMTGHTDIVTSLSVYNGTLFSGSNDKTVMMWNTTTGSSIGRTPPVGGYVMAVSVLYGTIFAGDSNGMIYMCSMGLDLQKPCVWISAAGPYSGGLDTLMAVGNNLFFTSVWSPQYYQWAITWGANYTSYAVKQLVWQWFPDYYPQKLIATGNLAT